MQILHHADLASMAASGALFGERHPSPDRFLRVSIGRSLTADTIDRKPEASDASASALPPAA
jgi:hypothetical protein